MSKLEAVIFDMDGVLVDSEPWHYEIECQLFRNLNLEVPDEIHRTYVGTDGDFMYSDLKKRYNIGIDLAGLLEWDSRFRVEVFKQMNDNGEVELLLAHGRGF
jgi:beta-phosphoglucomutase-like phosphatase (HAD superfamily)